MGIPGAVVGQKALPKMYSATHKIAAVIFGVEKCVFLGAKNTDLFEDFFETPGRKAQERLFRDFFTVSANMEGLETPVDDRLGTQCKTATYEMGLPPPSQADMLLKFLWRA